MRCISLWQPWASAIPLGLKAVETRHWSTDYRGPLAIHAAQRWTREQREFASVERTLGRLPERMPLGAIVAICNLVDVKRTDEIAPVVSAIERIYGNYGPDRFGWILEGIRPLAEPIPYKGRQGFFNIPDDLPGLDKLLPALAVNRG